MISGPHLPRMTRDVMNDAVAAICKTGDAGRRLPGALALFSGQETGLGKGFMWWERVVLHAGVMGEREKLV